MDIDTAVGTLDLSLFSAIPSQTTNEGKRSLLAAQSAIRDLRNSYEYLEIGSFLGGSIQPHLVDPRCRCIYSVDKRPPMVRADNRRISCPYRSGSTSRMLELLSAISQEAVSKIKIFERDSRSIDPHEIGAPDICFIDGEHTTGAVCADWQFCLRVCRPGGIILFHDVDIVFSAIRKMIRYIRRHRIPVSAGRLAGSIYYVCLAANSPVPTHPAFKLQTVGNDLFSVRLDFNLLVTRLYNRSRANAAGLRMLRAASLLVAYARRMGIPIPSLGGHFLR